MSVCRNCAEQLEEGQNFCPYCGTVQDDVAQSGAVGARVESSTALERVASNERERASERAEARAAQPVSFASFEKRTEAPDSSRRNLFIIVGLASAVLVAGLFYLATRPRAQTTEAHLEGALRPGAPEFEQYKERLVLEFDADQNAMTHERALGDVVVTMEPIVRNFTGRTVTGLELRAAAFDISNQIIKERTYVIIPDRQPALEPFKTMTPNLKIEGIKKDNVPASLKVEITGFKLK